MSRLPRGSRARAAVLVVTIVVVVAASTVSPAALQLAGVADAPAYDVEELVPDRAAAEGEPSVERRAESGVVLVDLAHSNRVSVDEIRPLLSTITEAGYEVEFLEGGDDLDRSLSRADAFVVIDPGVSYSDAEAVRVEAFVDRGGRLLLVGEPTQGTLTQFGLAVQRSELAPLASRFGFEFGEAYLFNMGDNDGNHLNVFAEPTGASTVTSGLSRTALYTATTVQTRDGGQPILVAGPGTQSSRTDATGRYPVGAVKGDVLALGDGTFLRGNNYQVLDNERLVGNVVRFLVSGEKERALANYPAFLDGSPTVHYTGPALLPAAQLIGTDLRQTGRNPALSINRRGVSPNRTDVLITTFDYLADRGSDGTGIIATDRRVRVPGYESNNTGIIVVRAPENGYDLVIAADTPGRAAQAAGLLARGTLEDDLLDSRTAVVRTDAAIRLVTADD